MQISAANKSVKSSQKPVISNFKHQSHKRSTSDAAQDRSKERKPTHIRKSSVNKKPLSNINSTPSTSSAIKQMYGLQQPKMFDLLSYNTQDSEQKSI